MTCKQEKQQLACSGSHQDAELSNLFGGLEGE